MSLCLVSTSPKPFTYYAAHQHTTYELILNFEGEGIITISGQEYPFHPGSVHIIPKNTSHIKQSEFPFRDVYFQADTLSVIPGAIAIDQPIMFSDDSEKTLEKLMKMLLYRYLQGNKNDTILQSMYELILQIVEETYRKDRKDPVIENIVQLLMSSFNDPEFSVSDMLTATGYSKDHIRRRFIREIGMTPNEYLISIRITHAKKLLQQQKQAHLSIADISAMCGYYDARYFSRIFKEKTGLPPFEYAKSTL